MRKVLPSLTATILAGSFAVASVVPLNAAPVFVPKPEQVRNDVEQVHSRRQWRKYRNWRAERRWKRYALRRYDDDYYYWRYPRYRQPGISLYFSF